jgi:DNA-binding beta-propeller fold protein YncE
MRRLLFALFAPLLFTAASADDAMPYHILQTVRVGGVGGFDYVHADPAGRRLYIARSGRDNPRITIFDLDTLKPAGEIAGVNAHGVAVDPVSHHAFATSKPVAMFDTASPALVRTVGVGGSPDGILFDPFNAHVYVFSHTAPNVTVLNAEDGLQVGTLDLGAAPEQAASDGNGHLYIDLESANQVAVVDAKLLSVTARYDLGGKGGVPVGLALDAKNRVLFVACRDPQALVMLDADTGAVLDAFPLGKQNDGVVFNAATQEAFASQGDGSLAVVKETAPRRFVLEQTLATKDGARTLSLDSKTGHVFLITADFAPPPANAPTPQPGRIARGPMIPDSFTILEVGR